MDDLPSDDWINNGGNFIGTNHIHESIFDPRSIFEKSFYGWLVYGNARFNQRNELLETYH